MKAQKIDEVAKGKHLIVNGKDVGEVIHVYAKYYDYHFLTVNENTQYGPQETTMYYNASQMERLLAGKRVTQGHRYNGGYVIRDYGTTTYELKGGKQ